MTTFKPTAMIFSTSWHPQHARIQKSAWKFLPHPHHRLQASNFLRPPAWSIHFASFSLKDSQYPPVRGSCEGYVLLRSRLLLRASFNLRVIFCSFWVFVVGSLNPRKSLLSPEPEPNLKVEKSDQDLERCQTLVPAARIFLKVTRRPTSPNTTLTHLFTFSEHSQPKIISIFNGIS